MVDDDAPSWIFSFKWHAMKARYTWYAVRDLPRVMGKKRKQYLHRAILNLGKDEKVDHIDGNGLNNQRLNLRRATQSFNLRAKMTKRPGCSSVGRGVTWCRSVGKWMAQIHWSVGPSRTQGLVIGYFADQKSAMLARDAKAREMGWPEEGMNFPANVS